MYSRVILIPLIGNLMLAGFVLATLEQGDWETFKSQHGKSYESRPVEAMRRAIFTRNKQLVDQFNVEKSKGAGYKLGLNHLSDWTESELDKLRGFKLPQNHEALLENSPEAEQFLKNILDDNSIEVPDSLDWRKVPNRVTEVKDQGYCGSCWAFAATGALEGQEVVRNITLENRGIISLSEQNLVDCARENDGCRGGWVKPALEAVAKEGGIQDETSYPYLDDTQNKCAFNISKSVVTDSGAAMLPKGDELILKEMVAKFGPVAVGIDSQGHEFFSYHSGVYFNIKCDPNIITHAMLIVGYGIDPKQGDYWILKNSWTDDWGYKGYMLLARNRGNHCGIASKATIPTFST